MPVWRSINGLAVFHCGGLVLAEEPADRIPATPADTIVITSQSLVFKNQENMVVCDGKVAMTKVGFIMHADHMIVHFAGASETATPAQKSSAKPAPPSGRTGPELPTLGTRSVSWIEAMGNVIMEQGGKKSKSKRAVYCQPDDKIVLTSEPASRDERYTDT